MFKFNMFSNNSMEYKRNGTFNFEDKSLQILFETLK